MYYSYECLTESFCRSSFSCFTCFFKLSLISSKIDARSQLLFEVYTWRLCVVYILADTSYLFRSPSISLIFILHRASSILGDILLRWFIMLWNFYFTSSASNGSSAGNPIIYTGISFWVCSPNNEIISLYVIIPIISSDDWTIA